LREDPSAIESRSDVPSREEFLAFYYLCNRPLLLKGIAAGWPALTRWTKSYLIERCGAQSVEVMMNRLGAAVELQNTGRHLRHSMAFCDFVNLVYDSGPSNDYYLVSRNQFFSNPQNRVLFDDVEELPFVNVKSANGDVKLWFGPAGTVTPLHYDDKNNLVVQIVGRKRVRLCAPIYSQHMEQNQPWYAGMDPGVKASTSGKPPEISLTLEAGDALFIPVGWWHAVYADEVSLTLACVDFGAPNSYPF
jgi:hypothetical protein